MKAQPILFLTKIYYHGLSSLAAEASWLHGGYIYWIKQWARSNGGNTTNSAVALYKAKAFDKAMGGVDVNTGEWNAENTPTEEVVCTMDFTQAPLLDYYTDTSSNNWNKESKHYQLSDDATHLYVLVYSGANTSTVVKIDVSTGLPVYNYDIDHSHYTKPTHTSYPHRRWHTFYVDETEGYAYLGLWSGYDNDEDDATRGGSIGVMKIDLADGSIFKDYKIYDRTTDGKLSEDFGLSFNYRDVDRSFGYMYPQDDAIVIAVSCNSENSRGSYTVPFVVDRNLTKWAYNRHYDNNYYNSYWRHYIQRTPPKHFSGGTLSFYKYSKELSTYYHIGSELRLGFKVSNYLGYNVLLENALVSPITKTTNHLLRVTYEVLIPWRAEGLSASNIEWNG